MLPKRVITARDRVGEAPDRMLALKTARVFVATSMGSPIVADDEPWGRGIADFVGRRVQVIQTFASARLAREWPLKGRRRRSPGQPVVRWVLRRMGRPGNHVFIGGRSYRQSGKGEWFASGDEDGPRDHGDPTWPLDALHGAPTQIEVVGDERVRDKPTTRYRFTADLQLAAERAPHRLALPAWDDAPVTERPVELWLGERGEVRRISYGEGPPGETPSFWRTTEFSDFGIDADIQTPHPVISLDEDETS